MVLNTIYYLDRINQKGFKQIHKIYMGICMFFYRCKCFRYLTILQKVYLFDVTNQHTKKSPILKRTGVLLISMLFRALL